MTKLSESSSRSSSEKCCEGKRWLILGFLLFALLCFTMFYYSNECLQMVIMMVKLPFFSGNQEGLERGRFILNDHGCQLELEESGVE